MSSNPPIIREEPGDEVDDVLFDTLYNIRTIELNRPKKLNSLNGSMARKIIPRLQACIPFFTNRMFLIKFLLSGMGKVANGKYHIDPRIRT